MDLINEILWKLVDGEMGVDKEEISQEYEFYWAKLLNGVVEYADPKRDARTISDYFCGTAVGLIECVKEHYFRRGAKTALDFITSVYAPPPKKSERRIETEFERCVEKVELLKVGGVDNNEI